MNPNQQPNQPFQPSVPPQQIQPAPAVSGSLLPQQRSKMPLILAVVFGLLFFVSLGFGMWAFNERSDYKNNSDAKAQEAVDAALEVQKNELSTEFAEQAKEPFLKYQGPATYGSFSFEYPRTWSVYLEESANSSNLYTLYMHPNFIEDVSDSEKIQAFTLEVVGNTYESEISRLESAAKRGDITASAYRPGLVESVLGARVRGEIENSLNGQRVYLPIRDRTLILTAESNDFTSDFDRILSTLSFTP